MKKIFTVKLRNINKKPITQKLCLLSGKTPTKDIIFELFTQHSGKSSTLYLSNNKQCLLKAELTKYNRKQEFYRWISRELLKKLLFINLDARREYKGYKLVRVKNSAAIWVGCASVASRIYAIVYFNRL